MLQDINCELWHDQDFATRVRHGCGDSIFYRIMVIAKRIEEVLSKFAHRLFPEVVVGSVSLPFCTKLLVSIVMKRQSKPLHR